VSRPLRVGDRVTATGTVSTVEPAEGHVTVNFDGTTAPNGFYIKDADALTLIAPAEPPVGSVVVKDGVAYQRRGILERWYHPWGAAIEWGDISDGDVIFQPEDPS
jgi:hypothetical protein